MSIELKELARKLIRVFWSHDDPVEALSSLLEKELSEEPTMKALRAAMAWIDYRYPRKLNESIEDSKDPTLVGLATLRRLAMDADPNYRPERNDS